MSGRFRGRHLHAMAIDSNDPRSDPRSNVFLTATAYAGARSRPVRIRNLSVHGALLEGTSLPCDGSTVRLQRGSLIAVGEVAWQHDKHCGIRFNHPVNVEEWIKRAGPEGQQRIDAVVAEFRHGVRSEGHLAVLPGGERRDLLESVSAELLGICERIAALPNMSTALAEELLRIDAAAHSLRAGR